MKKNIINKRAFLGLVLSFVMLTPISAYANTTNSSTETLDAVQEAKKDVSDESNAITITDWTITSDLIVPKGYTKVNLVNCTVEATIVFEDNEKVNTIYIDEKSKVSTLDIKNDLVIENNGVINEVLVNKKTDIKGNGTIKKLLINQSSAINNNVEICFDFSDGQMFIKQPLTYYKGHTKVTSNIKNERIDIAGHIFRIDGNSDYIDSYENINGVSSIYKNGLKQTGLIDYNNSQYFADENGKVLVGWQNVNGQKTFFEGNGKKYTGSTGNAQLDAELDALLAEIIKDKTTEDEKLKALYDWVNSNLKWKSILVKPNMGIFSQEQVNQLGSYMLDNRRGSCEHFASLYALLHNRMGYPTKVVGGYGLSSGNEHTWIKVNIDGTYYNFDPQYERTYVKNSPYSQFKMTDEDARKSHSWQE